MNIRDRIVLITGASSGIGAVTAHELARHGATVVLAARRADQLRALADEIERAGGRALAVPTDVARRDEIDRLVQTTIDTYGRVDVLINNAGIGDGTDVVASDDADLVKIVTINLLAPARCIQAVVPHMRRQGGGAIINIGSVAGEIGVSGLYSGTKFGLRGLNDSLARELRRYNIAVVLIAPGYIRTPLTEGINVPMPGPEVVARAIVAAIRRPRRKIFVPWYYAPLAYIAKLTPWLLDRIVARQAVPQPDRRDRKSTS
ncbi:MAG TPA: SDR family NAD(P)-dependent oxidoreductase [Herpetosiphonaceae bacterium]